MRLYLGAAHVCIHTCELYHTITHEPIAQSGHVLNRERGITGCFEQIVKMAG